MLEQTTVPASRSIGPHDRLTGQATTAATIADADPATGSGGTIVDIATRRPSLRHAVLEPETRPVTGPDDVDALLRLARREPARPPSRLGLAAKRVIDLVGGTVILLLIGPFLLGVAALIAAFDGRPVLFRQSRAGLNEQPFEIYKFRTMRNGADAERAALRAHNEVNGGASFKMTDDPRITRVGRILRRASIDEMPQLLNVLRGEMSLVGPRPHPFDDLAGYQPWHHARTAMKPGMTGLWQISSRRDPDFDRWVELDLEYIRVWSPWLDIQIMFRTVPAMIRGEGR